MSGQTENDVKQVALELERELGRGRKKRLLRGLGVLVGIVAIVGGVVFYQKANAPPPPAKFTTVVPEKRDIALEVQATGTVDPVNQVEVGSQVSGRVVRVLVDFNDVVKKGQLLAEVDPNLAGAEVVQAKAQLAAARATKLRSEASVGALKKKKVRAEQLRAENLASAADLEQIESELDVALADLASSDAQISQLSARVSSAETTLGYTKIYSPIDGVVIDRKVEPGQTVAASFNTPVLFVIAQDLEEMRVLAEIDESDVGQVREGMNAEIVVDAFPDDRFDGVLKQVRLSPKTVEGVVTYVAVVTVKNREQKLRPGLTATATIVPKRVTGVLAIRNAALRFEPQAPQTAPGASSAAQAAPPASTGSPASGEKRVFVLGAGAEPAAIRRPVRVGLSDGVWTEVLSGLAEGERVIIEERVKEERRGPRIF